MDGDTLIGVILVAIAIVLTSSLVIWSRSSIEKISRKRGQSVRQILRERKSGRQT